MRVKELTKTHSKKVLGYIGKTLHLDIYYFVRGGFWLTLSYAIYVLTTLLLVIAFTRFTSKEFYGSYQFIVAVVSTIAVFSLPGLNDAISQSVAKGRERALIQGTAVKLRWSFGGSLALFILAGYFKFVWPKDFWWMFAVLGVFFPLFFSYESYQAFLLGKRAFDQSAKKDILNKFISMLFSLAVLYWTRSLILIIITAFLVPGILNWIFYTQITSRKLRGEDTNVVHYGWHLNFIRIFAVIGTHADKFVISYFLGLEQLAIFSIATAFPEGIKGVMKIIGPLALPKLAVEKHKMHYRDIRGKLLLATVVSAGVCVLGIFLTPLFVPLLFTSAYAASVPFAQILFASLIFGIPTVLLSTQLQAQKATKALYTSNILFAVLDVGFLLLLTPRFGILGACIARLITRYAATLQLWLASRSL